MATGSLPTAWNEDCPTRSLTISSWISGYQGPLTCSVYEDLFEAGTAAGSPWIVAWTTNLESHLIGRQGSRYATDTV
jgi:hypothetical protein